AVLDRLVGWRDPDGEQADSLPPADPGPPPGKGVLTQLPVLGAGGGGARHPTRRGDRRVGLSALWGRGEPRRGLPGGGGGGSPALVAGLTSLLKAPLPLRAKWERLAQLLREAEPRSSLARWLEDFTRDGGISRLQRLVVDHAAQHGLRQLFDYVRQSAE